MNSIKKWGLYLLCPLICFYVLPMLIRDTGSGMFILLGVVPIFCFVNAIYYGLRERKFLIYSILVGGLFVPAVYLFFNSSAMVYSVAYAVFSVVGCLIGVGIQCLKK